MQRILTRSMWAHVLSRWAVVLVILLGLLSLASILENEGDKPWLGMRATQAGDGLRVTWLQAGGWAWDAGVRPGDLVYRVDGVPADDPDALNDATSVTLLSARSGQVLKVPGEVMNAAQSPAERGSLLAIAGSFAVLGAIVFIVAADLLAASVLLVFSVSAAALMIGALGSMHGTGLSIGLEGISLTSLGSSALVLFLVFPTNRLHARIPRLLALASVVSTPLLWLACLLSYLVEPMLYEVVRPVAMLTVVVEMVGAIGAIVYSLIVAWRGGGASSRERQLVRRSLGTVALGALAGFGPFCGLYLAPLAVGQPSLVPGYVAVWTTTMLPLSLAVAVLSRQFLGIERLVRRGLLALFVWGAMIVTYAWLFWRLVMPLSRAATTEQLGGTVVVVGLAVTVGTFVKVSRLILRRLEAWLFHDVYDFTGTVHTFGAELAQMNGAAAVAQHALARLGRTLDLRWAQLDTLWPSQSYVWERSPGDYSEANRAAALRRDLIADGTRIGRLTLGAKLHDVDLTVEDEALLRALVPLIASALQSVLLLRRLEEQVALLADREQTLAALNGQLMRVQEEERRQLALELHDDPLQRVSLLARRLAGQGLDREQEWAEDVAVALRAICYGLRPPMLDDLGLATALKRLVSDVAARSDVEVDLQLECGCEVGVDRCDDCDRLADAHDRDLELALYRIAQEGLNNVLKHAQARHATVTLKRTERRYELRVSDDGRGSPNDYANHRSIGLAGMRERLTPWRGQVSIGPGPIAGTLVVARAQAAEPAYEAVTRAA